MDRRALFGLTVAAAAACAGAAQASGGGGGGAKTGYTRLPIVTANVRRSDGRSGVMTVETGVDALTPHMADIVPKSVPRLRAAYARVVQTEANALLPGAAPDIERLVRGLRTATQEVLGGPGARVLIGTVMIA